MARLIDADEVERKLRLCISSWGRDCNSNAPVIARTFEDALQRVIYAPTVDAVPVADMKEFAQDVAYQFGCYCEGGEQLCLSHMGLSTLEWAFDILGWENFHPIPECECEIDGCHRHATCGTPTADGYKRLCGGHFREVTKMVDGERKDND